MSPTLCWDMVSPRTPKTRLPNTSVAPPLGPFLAGCSAFAEFGVIGRSPQSFRELSQRFDPVGTMR